MKRSVAKVTLQGKDNFIIKHKKHIAIYQVHLWSSYNDESKIGSIGFNKVPNLTKCDCNEH